MHISFDFNLRRWMIGVWWWNAGSDIEIMIDIGPFEWLIQNDQEE